MDRFLAWAGVLLGLTGVVALFHSETTKVSFLYLLLVLLFAGTVAYLQWFTKRPDITILKLTKTLTLSSADGRTARLLHCQEFRPNYPNVDSIWFRNLVCDGTIGPLMIDGHPPDHEERMGCLLSIEKKYRKPLPAGEKQEVRLVYDLIDSFPEAEEALLHDAGVATKMLLLEVRFPVERPCRNARLHLLAAGTPMHEIRDGVVRSVDGLHITASIKHPKAGYTYELNWDW